jgi:hypothetical protein
LVQVEPLAQEDVAHDGRHAPSSQTSPAAHWLE